MEGFPSGVFGVFLGYTNGNGFAMRVQGEE
jgi:hypothetical protein